MGIKDDFTLLGIKLRGWKWEIGDRLKDQSNSMVRVMTTDPYIEGKKSGYEKAADEYKPVYEALRREYKHTENLLKNQIQEKDDNLVSLINKLQKLEAKEIACEKLFKEKKEKIETLQTSGMLVNYSLLKLVYEKKFTKAEKEGYEEAKEIYQKKLAELKENLKKLIKESEQELAKHDELISKTILCINEKLSNIAKIRMQIAEIELLS